MIKNILKVLMLTLLLVPVACAQQQSKTAENPVNIILFIGDDLAVKDIGPYGNEIVRTPHLDRLAQESLLFDRAFAASPTCGPSRSTMFTGLYPFRHGGHSNHSGVKEGTMSIAHYLQPLGYRVAIAGKLHVGPKSVFPFEKVSNTNVPEPGHEDKPGLNYDLNMEPVDSWLSNQDKGEPFMLIVADHSPHVVWPEDAIYDPDEVDIPSFHIDTEDTRKSRARYYSDITKMDSNVGKLLKSLDDHNLSDNTIVIFVADQGPQWPFGKWGLYDYGIQSPMLMRWPGVLQGGSSTEALISFADLVPTFVELAGGDVPDAAVDGKSFLPVLKGETDSHHDVVFASHTGDRHMNRAPMRMLRTEKYKYIRNLAPDVLYTTHMDKSKNHDGGREYWDSWVEKSFIDEHAAAVLWRYHNRPAEELYDVKADPEERHNLITDPQYSDLIENFRTQMASIREQQGDFETGPEDLFDRPARKKGEGPIAPYVFLD